MASSTPRIAIGQQPLLTSRRTAGTHRFALSGHTLSPRLLQTPLMSGAVQTPIGSRAWVPGCQHSGARPQATYQGRRCGHHAKGLVALMGETAATATFDPKWDFASQVGPLDVTDLAAESP
jgi:hypothetical protein